MVFEFIGGILTNSLALLSDAGHMLNDANSLLLIHVSLDWNFNNSELVFQANK